MTDKRNKFNHILRKIPQEKIKTDKNGHILNWNELSSDTKNWIRYD